MLIKLESTAKVVAKEEEDNLTKREGDKEEIVTLKDEEIGMETFHREKISYDSSIIKPK